ncbi:hypothetical protein [Paraburkholderia strydomiana]|uniref:hypothetical protein n=1 Tax=Paraburkholderia strydomiana TaxID=1245417 RepID=UPI0038BC94A6
MASRMITERIPQNPRVNKAATLSQEELMRIYRAAAGMDAVKPSTKASTKGVTPSTIGIAAKARLANAAKRAIVAADAIGSLIAARDGDDPQAADMAKKLMANKEFRSALAKALGKIHSEIIEAPFKEQSKVDNEAMNELQYPEAMAAAREQEQAGMDAARPILTAEDAERVERARAKVSRLKTAEGMGDAGDIVRARSGMDERALDADGLYGLFEGKRK